MATTNATECALKVCEPGSDGALLLPLAGEIEQKGSKALRAVIYMLFLFWFFMGVAIVADVFMSAIEKVTSRKVRVLNKNTMKWKTEKVWNDTVANLTLMALGSSAPEILLSVIELLGNDWYAGDLGPSTIVGSAAFNLFVIIAVCVSAIPTGEIRRIKDMKVFAVTAFFSVFAYIWLFLIVSVSSPDVIKIWEGLITFLLFPILVALAYMADKGYFTRGLSEERRITLQDASTKELAAMEMKIIQHAPSGITDDQIAALMEREYGAPVSRAAYRLGKARKSKRADGEVSTVSTVDDKSDVNRKKVYMSFVSDSYHVLENAGTVDVRVKRFGEPTNGSVVVKFKTVDGTAKGGEDYDIQEGTLEFTEVDQEHIIKIGIIDDDKLEPDEYFHVELFEPTTMGSTDETTIKAELGHISKCKVNIIDDDDPGVLSFFDDTMLVKEMERDHTISVKVERLNGGRGAISCNYKTEDDSAKAGLDYVHTSGVVTINDGEAETCIDVVIKPRGRYDTKDMFRLILEEPQGFEKFLSSRDGGPEQNIISVYITSDEKVKDRLDRVKLALHNNWEKSKIGHANWVDQFKDAISVSGGGDDDEESTPGVMDWVFHIINLPWKLLFAIIPPVDYCGGWLCFCVALMMIGIVTAFIGDLASLLGCCMGIPDSITAITFVALGTSLPDTFASKAAAEQDPYADASVGNVTGSNSVNVFLGLGLPWLMGAIYWSSKGLEQDWVTKYASESVVADYPNGGAFIVLGGSLGFSVGVFCGLAVTALALIMIRQGSSAVGGALGGPDKIKYATSVFLVVLWLTYVGMSCWKTLDDKGPCD